jgi:hypothetical protein
VSEIAPTHTPRWKSALWWALTLVTLFLIDDIFIGPIFWGISVVSPLLSTVLAFTSSFAFQVWVTRAGMSQRPTKWAQSYIDGLMLTQKKGEVVERKGSLQSTITSTVSAVLMSLLIGGILPVLLLHKNGKLKEKYLLRLMWLTSAIYATEFALIHGGYGLGAVARWAFGLLVGWLL